MSSKPPERIWLERREIYGINVWIESTSEGAEFVRADLVGERAAANKVADAARQLLLVEGYDGACMGDAIAPLMEAVVAYDALIASPTE